MKKSPDSSSLPGDHAVEELLRVYRPASPLPGAWRAEILGNALRKSRFQQIAAVIGERSRRDWKNWFIRGPVAAAWVIIAVLRATTPEHSVTSLRIAFHASEPPLGPEFLTWITLRAELVAYGETDEIHPHLKTAQL